MKYNLVKRKRKTHFKTRLKERYGISFTRRDMNQIKRKMQDNNCEYIMRISISKTALLVEFKGKIIYIIYSKTSNTFITALPLSNFFDMFRM